MADNSLPHLTAEGLAEQMRDLTAARPPVRVVHINDRWQIHEAIYEARGEWVGFTHDDPDLLRAWLSMDSAGGYVVAAFGGLNDSFHAAARATPKAIAQWDKNSKRDADAAAKAKEDVDSPHIPIFTLPK